VITGYVAMPCVDCLVDTAARGVDEYYMVHNDVWAAAGMAPRGGMLCVGCLEVRLGRWLTAGDFTGVPVNDLRRGWRGSARLLSRLTSATAVPAVA
jgi:hypothetical protein